MKCFKTPEVEDPVPIVPGLLMVSGIDVDGDAVILSNPNPRIQSSLQYDPTKNQIYWIPVESQSLPPSTQGHGLLMSDGTQYKIYNSPGIVSFDTSGAFNPILPGNDGEVLVMRGGTPFWSANPIMPTKILDGIMGTGVNSVVSYTISGLFMTDGYHWIKLTTAAPISADIGLPTPGAGALDIGTEAPSTWYYIFAISDGGAKSALIFSLNQYKPAMPDGYTYYARIGVVFNNAGSNFVAFAQTGNRVETNTNGSIFTYSTSGTPPGYPIPSGAVYVPVPQNGTYPLLQQVPRIAQTISFYTILGNTAAQTTPPMSVWFSPYLNQGSGMGAAGEYVTSTVVKVFNVRNMLIDKNNPQLYWCAAGGATSTFYAQGLFVVGYTIEN
jgi:hypothetical protein